MNAVRDFSPHSWLIAAMDDNLYDEFGVYIGPDLEDDDDVQSEPEQGFNGQETSERHEMVGMDVGT